MSGHSKWATIKRKKGALDAKRGNLFTKLVKEISVAARIGGGDPDGNPRLRLAIQSARSNSMPKENIDRAVKKATSTDADNYQETTYEANYGPVGIFIEATTDNLNRTLANVRTYLTKNGGTLGTNGSLSFIFSRKGIFNFLLSPGTNADDLTLELIDAGAEDVEIDEDYVTVTTTFEEFGAMQKKLETMNINLEQASIQRIPSTTVALDDDQFRKAMKLIDLLEEDDDVQKVYHNLEVSEAQEELMG